MAIHGDRDARTAHRRRRALADGRRCRRRDGAQVLLPTHLRLGPSWAVPAVEVALLLVLLVGDPSTLTRRSRLLRPVSIALVTVLVLSTLWVTLQLVGDLIQGGPETNSAEDVLEAGAVVWASNSSRSHCSTGSSTAAARPSVLTRPRRFPDLAFVQHVNPDLAPPGWRPRFLDYLYLGLHERHGVQPHRRDAAGRWAKLAMMLQSLISLVILGLVIARAVNVFT